MKKKLPRFKNEGNFAAFVETHDMAPFLDEMEPADKTLVLDPALAQKIKERSRKRLISLRLPVWQIEGAKRIAKRRGRPYQTLIQDWVGDGIRAIHS